MRNCDICRKDPDREIDYRDFEILKNYLNEKSKVIPRAKSGLCKKHYDQMRMAVKRARQIALLPYVFERRY